MPSNQDIPLYEQQKQIEYNYFGRFKDSLPQYIWDQLIGVTPQKRRAFLLQQRYLTPLTFSYVVFQFFAQYASNCIILQLFKFFWDYRGKEDKVITVILIGGFILAYIFYRITTSKNSVTIREEIVYRVLVDSLSVIFAIITVFNLSQYWAGKI